jgi:hypothetical protein
MSAKWISLTYQEMEVIKMIKLTFRYTRYALTALATVAFGRYLN